MTSGHTPVNQSPPAKARAFSPMLDARHHWMLAAALPDDGPAEAADMSWQLSALPEPERVTAVTAFNARFGEMDRALWTLSLNCRAELLEGHGLRVVEALVWAVKSWWGVQGVRSDTKAMMARALPQAVDWSPALFEDTSPVTADAEDFACTCVFALVSQSRAAGVARREFSLASKVLHWLLPYQVPAYDSYVCQALGIRGAADQPELAYRKVAQEVLGAARVITRVITGNSSWVGALEPRSPVRALDKCLWWLGGGNDGKAAQVRNPWRIVDELGLDHA
jgi:hypothetical protein